MLTSFTPGEWYLTVICLGCKKRIPAVHDLTKGESEIVGGYVLTCSACGHKDAYSREDVEHYQHPADSMASNQSP